MYIDNKYKYVFSRTPPLFCRNVGRLYALFWPLYASLQTITLKIFPYYYTEFFLVLSYTCMVPPNLFTQSPTDGHLNCFQYFTIMNRVAMNNIYNFMAQQVLL